MSGFYLISRSRQGSGRVGIPPAETKKVRLTIWYSRLGVDLDGRTFPCARGAQRTTPGGNHGSGHLPVLFLFLSLLQLFHRVRAGLVSPPQVQPSICDPLGHAPATGVWATLRIAQPPDPRKRSQLRLLKSKRFAPSIYDLFGRLHDELLCGRYLR
jgi:hypothetical protein